MSDTTRRRVLQSMITASLTASLAPAFRALAEEDPLIDSAAKALDVFDFERMARAKLPPAHFGYLATGVDGDATLRANRDGFGNYAVRARRMVDTRDVDMRVTMFGTTWATPIFMVPIGSQRAFHPDGELGSARAAKSRGHLQVLSTVSSTRVEDVNAARGEPVWFQLYPTDQWPVTEALVARARDAGCPVLVLTADLQGGSNRLTLARSIPRDSRDCTACHATSRTRLSGFIAGKPMFAGLDLSAVTDITPPGMTWEYLARLRDIWPRKLVIKGLVTREDAELAIAHGIDGIIVSNHGGRAEDSGRPAIDSLAEVAPAANGRVPVLMDSGIRRGSDVFKALALGAGAVGVGRPYVWGLASFGQEGVERVLDILRNELMIAMRQAGTRTLAEVTPEFVVDRRRV